jgi:hypothetical protein
MHHGADHIHRMLGQPLPAAAPLFVLVENLLLELAMLTPADMLA